MRANKKGDVWVSAVLYFGLGIVILTIILSAGTPVVNRLRDKNIVLQTKEVMHTLDSNIREVAREGPGSQRPLTVDIRKGEFVIDRVNDKVEWSYNTKALLSEPCNPTSQVDVNPKNGAPDECEDVIVKEGTLNILTEGVKGNYKVKMWLPYDQIFLVVPGVNANVVGRTNIVIRNGGLYCVTNAVAGEKKESADAACTEKEKKIGVVITS